MCLVLLSIITAAALIRISTVLLVEVAHRRSGYFSSNPDRNLNLEEGKTGVLGKKHLDRQQILHCNATSSIPSRLSHVTCERESEGEDEKRKSWQKRLQSLLLFLLSLRSWQNCFCVWESFDGEAAILAALSTRPRSCSAKTLITLTI